MAENPMTLKIQAICDFSISYNTTTVIIIIKY